MQLIPHPKHPTQKAAGGEQKQMLEQELSDAFAFIHEMRGSYVRIVDIWWRCWPVVARTFPENIGDGADQNA